MGRLRLEIILKTGEVDAFIVDSVMGYGFAGGYLIVHDTNGVHKPYSLGDIERFTTSSAAMETVH